MTNLTAVSTPEKNVTPTTEPWKDFVNDMYQRRLVKPAYTNLEGAISAEEYRKRSAKEKHHMYTLYVTLLPRHYITSQWLGYWYWENGLQAPREFLEYTHRIGADGRPCQAPDTQLSYELIAGHPLAIALREVFPNPGVLRNVVDPDFQNSSNMLSAECLWLTAAGRTKVARWDQIPYNERGNLVPVTITMDIREECALKYRLLKNKLPEHIRIKARQGAFHSFCGLLRSIVNRRQPVKQMSLPNLSTISVVTQVALLASF